MNKHRTWILAVTLGLFILPSSFADVAMSKQEKIHKLMDMTGTTKVALQVVDQILATVPNEASGQPSAFITEFRKAITADSLVALWTPIYEKYFTEKEVDDLIAFYQTETGQKIITNMPDVMRESQAVGRAWAQRIVQQIQDKVKGTGNPK